MAESLSFDTEKYILIAKVTKAHGIKGEVKMVAFSGELESITQHKELYLVLREDQHLTLYNVLRSRAGNKDVIVQLQGVTDRTEAEKLYGCQVLVEKNKLPGLAENEFYLHELEGLQVTTVEGELVGIVESFFHNGVQNILVVKKGKNECMIPLIPGIIVKRTQTDITIAPPPGLLDINSGDTAKD